MGLLSEIVLLPLSPLRGVLRLSEVIHDEAARQAYPADLASALDELDRQRQAGELSPEDAQRREEELIRDTLGPEGEP